jgi:acetyl esterase/lipase
MKYVAIVFLLFGLSLNSNSAELEHPLFRSSPNPKYSTFNPAPTASEFKAAESYGKFTIKKWSHKIARYIIRFVNYQPKQDDNFNISEITTGNKKSIIVEPKKRLAQGAIFFIHGGGLVAGSNKDVLKHAYYWAKELGVLVILPSYSLSPQHPFPTAQDDLHKTWHWLLSNSSKLKIDPNKIIIAGTSAGGGLATTLAQRLYDEKGIQPAAQLLIYPMLDDRTATRTDIGDIKHLVWNNRSNYFGWSSYLSKEPGTFVPPKYSVAARRKDLRGLPPTWIGVGNADLFIDEDREYAKRLREAGVDVTYIEVDGGVHAFDNMKGPVGDAFRREHTKFAKRFIK